MIHHFSVLLAVAYRDFAREVRAPMPTILGLIIGIFTMVTFSFGISGLRPESIAETRLFVLSGYLPFHLFLGGMLGSATLMVENEDLRFSNLYFVAPVPRPTILLAKLLVVCVRCLIDIVVLLVVIRLMGIRLPLHQWLALASAGWASCLLGGAFGIQLASIAGDLRSANALMPVVAMPQMLFGGVLMPVEGFPFPLSVLTWVMPLRYGVDMCRSMVGSHASTPVALDLAVYGVLFSSVLALGVRNFARIEVRP